MNEFSVILFHSNNYVMWTTKVLKKARIQYKVMSIPRDLSSDCGYCVRIRTADTEEVTEKLNSAGIEYDRVAPMES